MARSALRVKRTNKRVIRKPAPSAKTTKVKPSKKRSAFAEAKKKAGMTGYTGSEGFKQAKREKAKAEENRRRRNVPWGLRLAPGTEADFIITSAQPYFMYEHQFKGSDGKYTTERCIKDQGNCPLCSKLNREGYYVMKLGGIDLRGYKKQDGTKVKASQKILNVKQGQIPKFERFYGRNNDSFRGLKLHLIRDGEKDFAIGNDIEVTATLSEQKLAKYGQDLSKELDMEEAFPRLSEKAMANQYGATMAMGSSDFNSDDDDEDADDEDWG